MKSLFLTLAFLVSANTAMAGGVYFSSNCVAKTIDGDEIKIGVEGRPTDSYQLESDKLSNDENLVTWSGKEKDEEGTVFNLVLDLANRTKIQEKNGVEECFEYESGVTLDYAVVKKVSKKISQTLNIKKGQKLAFLCYSRVSYGPTSKCN